MGGLQFSPKKSSDHLHMIFATHGLPKVLVTDNGSQFTSAEFKMFTQSNGVHHSFSAPYHPASNGLAERAVQSFKEHMKRMESGSLQEKLAKFLLWYRLTPHSTTGDSPAELLMGRRPRSKPDLLKPDLTDSVQRKQQAQKKNHDIHSKLPTLVVGKKFYIKDFPSGKDWIAGEVSEQKGPLTYYVKLPDGRVVRRHIDAIRIRTSETTSATSSATDDVEIPPASITSAPPDTDSNTDTSSPVTNPTAETGVRQRPLRTRRQPDYLGFQQNT